MDLYTVEPVEDFTTSGEEMDPIFEESVARALDSWPRHANISQPVPIDVFAIGDHYLIQADIPGMQPEKLDIDLSEHALKIKGEFHFNRDIQERELGKFERTVDLPSKVNPGQYETSYQNGVLQVVIAKAG